MAPEPALPASNRVQRGHRKKRSLSDSISLVGSYTIGWAAPTEQVRFLVVSGDAVRWVGFRDGFMSKWTNLNIVVRCLKSINSPSADVSRSVV